MAQRQARGSDSLTLATYAFRTGPLPVDEVTEAQVRSVLIAIWLEKPKTARRLRRRINAVMDWTPRTDGRLGGILRKRRMNGRGGPAAFAPATRTHIASIMFWSVGRRNDPRRPAKPAHANARDVGCQRQYPRRRWDGLSARTPSAPMGQIEQVGDGGFLVHRREQKRTKMKQKSMTNKDPAEKAVRDSPQDAA